MSEKSTTTKTPPKPPVGRERTVKGDQKPIDIRVQTKIPKEK